MIASDDRIGAIFTRARERHRRPLIAYIVAGDPDRATTDAAIDALTAGGVDLIELGIPYGDPLADGPTISAAAFRGLASGTTTDGAIAIAKAARARGSAPIVFFTYTNPVVQFGATRFAAAARSAGALGAIVPDVPLEELDEIRPAFHAEGLGIPLLIAPTTPLERATRIAAASDGFVYVVSRLGVTGAGRQPDFAATADHVRRLRTVTPKPLAVGFGIASPADVRAVEAFADGTIVGSALIDAYAGARGAEAARRIAAFLTYIRNT